MTTLVFRLLTHPLRTRSLPPLSTRQSPAAAVSFNPCPAGNRRCARRFDSFRISPRDVLARLPSAAATELTSEFFAKVFYANIY